MDVTISAYFLRQAPGSVTGAFTNGENLQVASSTKAVASGADAAITLLPSGRYECIKENFGGAANTTRVYGADGVNKAFEFDGTVFVPIRTGMTTDTPAHIFAHKKQLFLSFDGSAQHSGPGTPYQFTLITGAGELGMGDTITGFAGQPGSEAGAALAIFTRNRLSILYGSDSSDWNLVAYRDEIGAYAHTIQDVGFTMFLDDRGITDIRTSQSFGNFAHNAVSDRIRNDLNENRTLAIASCISRDRNQYRLFCSNNKAYYVTITGGKVIGIMPMLFEHTPRCAWTAEDTDGSEVMFMGSDDGYVFQMDRGTSFDGEDIEFYTDLAWNFQRSPRVDKNYRDASLELDGSGYATFSFGYALGYEDTEIPQPSYQAVTTNFAATRWDTFTWDAFFWDGSTLLPSVVDVDGMAENISIGIRGQGDYFEPFTLTGVVIHYTPTRRLRP